MSEPPTGVEGHSDLLDTILSLLEIADVPNSNKLELCQLALSMVDRGHAPELWAQLHAKMASLWDQEQSGHKADNQERAILQEQAIKHYQLALEVSPPQALLRNWAQFRWNLGKRFRERVLGEKADNLEQAITHFHQALEVFTQLRAPQDCAKTQMLLGDVFRERIHGRKADNLEQAIAHYQQALRVLTLQRFPQEWMLAQAKISAAYMDATMLDQGSCPDADNLEQAIAHFQQMLERCARQETPLGWAILQMKLGTLFRERIRGEKADNLERSIEHSQQALEIFTRQVFPAAWAMTHMNLGNAFRERIHGEKADNLEQALAHHQQALEVFTRQDSPGDWALVQLNLALVFLDRIRGDKADNVDQSIKHSLSALEIFTQQSAAGDWARIQGNLGLVFLQRIRGEKADNLEQSIEHSQHALKVFSRQESPVDWAGAQMNLGLAFGSRISGDRADNLERSIDYYQRVLELFTPQNYPQLWAMNQANLGNAFRERLRGEKAENLEQAIAHFELALMVFTRRAFPRDWAGVQAGLGECFRQRIHGRKADNLERAIEHHQQALEIFTQQAFPLEWASTQTNLGNTFQQRSRRARADNVEAAILHHQQALEIFTQQAFPREWASAQLNLGSAFWVRIHGAKADNLEQAIKHFHQALEVFSLQTFPHMHRDVQLSLGNLHFQGERWQEAHAAYGAAIDAGALLLQAAYTEAGRRIEVGGTSRLYSDDAWCLLKLKRPAEALQQIENGKARLLDEVLALTEAEASLLPGASRDALLAARQRVRELEFEARLPPDTPARRDDRALADALLRARGHLDELVSQLRQQHPDFMPSGLALSELLALIPAGGAMVVPLVTPKGTASFVLPEGTQAVDESHLVQSDSFTEQALRTLFLGPTDSSQPSAWLGASFVFNSHPESPEARKQWFDTIESTGRYLWQAVMGPVHSRLKALGLAEEAPVVLIPQGALGMLPLHAAWRPTGDGGRRYFLDDWTVSYAPGGYALAVSHRRIQQPQRHHRTLLTVIPTSNLKYAPAEGYAVAARFSEVRLLEGPEATPARVLEQVHNCNYLHFCCHGSHDWLDVMQSHLVLADHQWLTLAQVIGELDLGSCRLVTLSACETGMIDFGQAPDEYVGLPAAFLQAGAPTVLSTLWSVNDLSTWLLIERFYSHLEHGFPAATALRQAQRWVRDLRVDELRLYLEQQKPEVARHIPAELRQRLDTEAPDRQPFKRPFWWAAFTLSGA